VRLSQLGYFLAEERLDAENLPNQDLVAEEIFESLQSALTQFESIAEELGEESK
jgi:hypothetical protein